MNASKATSDARSHAISRAIVSVVVIVLILAAGAAYLYVNPPPSTSAQTVPSSELTFTNLGASATTTTTSATSAPTSGIVVNVDIPSDNGYPFAQYTPQVITVVIGVNNTVVWTNHDVIVHNILTASGLFASGDMGPGTTYTYTFTQAGTYPYYCSYHPSMAGVVIVKT